MTQLSWKSILVILLAAGLLCGGSLLLRTTRSAEVTRQESVALP